MPPQPSSALLILAAAVVLAGVCPASQPHSLKDVPDPNPEVQKAGFVVPDGFEINLFAGDPMIRKPVQMNWDSKGRLWVVSSTTYPHIKPGEAAKDQVVVLEDTDHDGKADKSTVFSDDLHIPTALAPGDGGLYVANSTEVLFMKDANGDLKPDDRTILLSGFGTEDTHHLLHTMRWGPEGMLYFLQSIYIHSHIETPHGVRRLMGGGVWEFRPETRRLEVISKGLINPWGFEFDRWGQSFACDGAGSEGVNFIFPGSVFATSPGAKRILHGLSPGQPKQCAMDIIEDPHFPDDWQGTFVLNDFRGNRINRFKLARAGSGYTATQLPDVLASNHRAFRPIDVKVGPDGALYIADWYNPIIQHGEVDFRDERRDHSHGRIWRLTAKGRPLSERPVFEGKSAEELVAMLRSPRKWARLFAKRELRDAGAAKVVPAVDAAAGALPSSGDLPEADAHFLLELAWAREGVNAFSPKLWRQIWAVPDPRVRAAALRILTHRWKELPGAQKIAEAAVADADGQVRLWGLAVLAEMRTPAAFGAALGALKSPMDENLDFLLEQIAREQAEVWMPSYLKGTLKIDDPRQLIYAMKSTGRADAMPPLLDLLRTGRLATEDVAAVSAVAGQAVDAAQAAALAAIANEPALAQHQPVLLDALVAAGSARGIVPKGAEALVQAWLAGGKPETAHRATLLAGFWKVESAREALAKIAADKAANPAIREGAVTGLTKLGGTASRDFFDNLFKTQPDARDLAIRGLSDVGPVLAAKRAVEFLSQAKSGAEASVVFGAFLRNKQLPNALAKELDGKTIPEAVAVEGIRMASSRAVQGPLIETLKKAGGVKQMDRPPTPEEMAALVAKVKSSGDPGRGEAVYRRQQLLCQTCHAIGGAGGTLGPDLVSIGASAPVDYLIESLLEPSKKVKEGYHMVVVTTKEGQIVSGGLVQDGQDEVVIRDPANQLHKVPKAKIASRQMGTVSMMPPGLTASLREDEFVDLVRFLSELGREGDYKIKPNRYVRTWKTMGVMTQEQIDHVRHVGLHALNDPAYPYPWQAGYSTVKGDLPLAELPNAQRMYPWFPKIVQFTVPSPGSARVRLRATGVSGAILASKDAELRTEGTEWAVSLQTGENVFSLIVPRDSKAEAVLIEVVE